MNNLKKMKKDYMEKTDAQRLVYVCELQTKARVLKNLLEEINSTTPNMFTEGWEAHNKIAMMVFVQWKDAFDEEEMFCQAVRELASETDN